MLRYINKYTFNNYIVICIDNACVNYCDIEGNNCDRKSTLNFMVAPLAALNRLRSVITRTHCVHCAFTPCTSVHRECARTHMHWTETSVAVVVLPLVFFALPMQLNDCHR